MSNLLAEIVINAVINSKDYDSYIKSQLPLVPITDDTIDSECEKNINKNVSFSKYFASYNIMF